MTREEWILEAAAGYVSDFGVDGFTAVCAACALYELKAAPHSGWDDERRPPNPLAAVQWDMDRDGEPLVDLDNLPIDDEVNLLAKKLRIAFGNLYEHHTDHFP